MHSLDGWNDSPQRLRVHPSPAFRNELFSELARLSAVDHSFATAYSKEENGIVERANQEVMRHLRAILFDASSFPWYNVL